MYYFVKLLKLKIIINWTTGKILEYCTRTPKCHLQQQVKYCEHGWAHTASSLIR